MASSTKPGLDAAAAAVATDVLAVRQSGDTRDKRVTLAQVRTLIQTLLTELTVDNIKIDLNTISSTNANGNITLVPNGTGLIQVGTGGPGLRNNSGDLEVRNAANSNYNSLGAQFFFAIDGSSYKAKMGGTYGVIVGTGAQLLFSDQGSLAGITTGAAGIKYDSPGVMLDTDGSTGVGRRLTGRVIEASTVGSGAPNVLAATESRKLLTNEGAAAEAYNTLPSAAAGMEFVFYCQDTDGIRVTAAAGDTIRLGGTVSAAAGFVRSVVAGSAVILTAINATEWIAIGITGTWTVDA